MRKAKPHPASAAGPYPGLGEEGVPFRSGKGAAFQGQLSVGQDGRILIPAEVREALGIRRGGKVVAEVRDGVLLIDTLEARLARIQAALAPLKRPGESVVDEFIAEKRAEAARE